MNADEYTNREEHLAVGDGHKLYIHDWGNPKAKLPILFLHGGPGVGFNDGYKQQYEPKRQRVIFFDQRGAGKSTPKGELKNNITKDLVEDIEKIAKHLKLDKFIITGGSWGSTLALVYAIEHPQKVAAMVLRGIFTGSQEEIDFIENGRFRDFFPDVWEEYSKTVPPDWRQDPSAYHFAAVSGKDSKKAKASAYAYETMEGALLHLDDRFTAEKFNEYDPASIKIEMHYIKNGCFLPDNYIFDNAARLKMPIWLVQGRYDMVCPPKTAYKLHQKLPNSELIWTTAGHGNDRPNYDVTRTLLLQLTKGS